MGNLKRTFEPKNYEPTELEMALASLLANPGVGADGFTIRAMLSTPSSHMANFLLDNAESIRAAGLELTVLFASFDKTAQNNAWLARFHKVFGSQKAKNNVRLLRNIRPSRATEQVCFGGAHLWTGLSLDDHSGADLESGSLVSVIGNSEAESADTVARLAFAVGWKSGHSPTASPEANTVPAKTPLSRLLSRFTPSVAKAH